MGGRDTFVSRFRGKISRTPLPRLGGIAPDGGQWSGNRVARATGDVAMDSKVLCARIGRASRGRAFESPAGMARPVKQMPVAVRIIDARERRSFELGSFHDRGQQRRLRLFVYFELAIL